MASESYCQTVLVVEDDDAIRQSLVDLLVAEGYSTYAASNGKDALALLEDIPKPCLILLDLMMPIMDGWEFSKLKEKNTILAPIPIVVVSAYPTQVGLQGSVAHIKKPIHVNTLLAVVREYCGHS